MFYFMECTANIFILHGVRCTTSIFKTNTNPNFYYLDFWGGFTHFARGDCHHTSRPPVHEQRGGG